MLTAAQVHDSILFEPLLEAVAIPNRTGGRPRKRPFSVCADPAYSSHSNRVYCSAHGIRPVIKPSSRQKIKTNLNEQKYQERNIVERCFSWLKEYRRIATRYEKLAENYQAMVTLGCIGICLRRLFQ